MEKKNNANFELEKKRSRITLKSVLGVLGLTLGRVWDSLGPLLGALGRFLDVQNQAFFKHWPEMGSKRLSGSILGRFGKGFGKVLREFGKVLGRFEQDLAWH